MNRRATWKDSERAIAAAIGGKRVPVTGRGRGDAPDIAHPWLAVEVKHRASLPGWLTGALAQAVASKRGDQLPVAIIHEAGKRHTENLIVLRQKDFVLWFGDVEEGGNE